MSLLCIVPPDSNSEDSTSNETRRKRYGRAPAAFPSLIQRVASAHMLGERMRDAPPPMTVVRPFPFRASQHGVSVALFYVAVSVVGGSNLASALSTDHTSVQTN